MVDDDPETLRYVRDALAETDYAPVMTGDPEQLPALISTHKPRLVLLDLMLPGTDGVELMEGLRELEDLPVIFISAYDRDETIVRALDAGAADYIVKPFSPSELRARVRAALRRRAEPEPFLLGELAIPLRGPPRHRGRPSRDLDGHRVRGAPRALDQRRPGRDVRIAAAAGLGQADRGSTDPKLVRALVKGLRRKQGDDAANPAYVRNERGVGYRMPRPGER